MARTIARAALLLTSGLGSEGLSISPLQLHRLDERQNQTEEARLHMLRGELQSLESQVSAIKLELQGMALRDSDDANALASKEFNMSNLMGSLNRTKIECPMALEEFKDGRVAGIFPTRSGSRFMHDAISYRLAKQEQEFRHTCRVRDVSAAGAKHVLVSLRPILERIKSSIRAWPEESGHQPGGPFFESGGFNNFLNALRDVEDPKHSYAMDHAFRIKAFWPAFEFYLNGDEKHEGTSVKFACVCSIDTDVANAFQDWGMNSTCAAANASNCTDWQSDGKSNEDIYISKKNRKWLKQVYNQDQALLKKHCSKCKPPKFKASEVEDDGTMQ